MRSIFKHTAGLVACAAALGVAAPGLTADAPDTSAAPAGKTAVDKDQKILAAKTFRASKLTGMNVRNMEGEKLGTVNDLVIDVATGKVSYAALSHGGVLGIGDKLFAVPFGQLKFDHGQDEMFFVLDMSKEKLEAAPGFDQSVWPDFADPNWSSKIDEYYRKSQTETRTKTSETNPEPRNR